MTNPVVTLRASAILPALADTQLVAKRATTAVLPSVPAAPRSTLPVGLQPPRGEAAPVASRFPTIVAEDAFQTIVDSYVDPVSPLQLTAAGLNQLRIVEPALDVSVDGEALALSWNGTPVAREVPADASVSAHLSAAARLIDVVSERSSRMGRIDGVMQSQAFVAGMVRSLDIYSRAITADELTALEASLTPRSSGGSAQAVARSALSTTAQTFDAPVITIPTFTATTAAEVEAKLLPLVHTGATGVVIDLRGSTGGHLDAAAATADLFLRTGVTGDLGARDPGFVQHSEAHRDSPLERLRVVIVTDGATVSASEEFAAMLGDVGRAAIVGYPTFGKGRAQTIMRLRSGEGLVLTIGNFFGPTGATIDGTGVMPAVCEDGQSAAEADNPTLFEARRMSASSGRNLMVSVCRPMRSNDPRDIAVARRLLADDEAYARAATRQQRLAGRKSTQ